MPQIKLTAARFKDVTVKVEGSVTEAENTFFRIHVDDPYKAIGVHLTPAGLDDLITVLTYQRDHGKPHSSHAFNEMGDWERELLNIEMEDDGF